MKKDKQNPLTLSDLMWEGGEEAMMIWRKDYARVREHLDLTAEQMLYADDDFIRFVVGALRLGKQIEKVNGVFRCSEIPEHISEYAIKVLLAPTDPRLLCPAHILSEIKYVNQPMHDHAGISNLRQSLDN